MSEIPTGISLLLATSMALSACSSPDTIPPPVAVRATPVPAKLVQPKYIATSTARPTELDLRRSTSLAEIVLDSRHSALIGPNGEPCFFTAGDNDYLNKLPDYRGEKITPQTKVTSSIIKLKVPNSAVTVDVQFYKIGTGIPQSEQDIQESFTFVINYFKQVLDRALSNKQNQSSEYREAINLINQQGGVSEYVEKRLALLSGKGIITEWNQKISGGDGPLYGVILPPPKPSSKAPLPTAEAIRRIVTQKTTLQTVDVQFFDLIELLNPSAEIRNQPELFRFSGGAGASMFNSETGQFSIAIDPLLAQLHSPDIDLLQTPEKSKESALTNELSNILALGLHRSVQVLIYSQVMTDTKVDPIKLKQAELVNPGTANEVLSTVSMIEQMKITLSAHK